jgi:hypothetical protein
MAVRLSALLAGRPLPPRKIPGVRLCYRLGKPHGLVRLEGLGKLKNSMASTGIEPASFRL